MAKYTLLNCVLVGSHKHFAGETFDDSVESIPALQSAGAQLGDATNGAIAAAAALCLQYRFQGKPDEFLNGIMLGAVQADLAPTPQSNISIIADGNANIDFTLGHRAILTAVPFTASRTFTLIVSGTGPYPLTKGCRRRVTNLDTSANTKVIANGGGGGGNVATIAASKVGDIEVEFDGTNFVFVGGGPT